MITAINSVNQSKFVKTNGISKVSGQNIVTPELKNDSFEKSSPTFGALGMKAITQKYERAMIAKVKKGLDVPADVWKKNIYKEKYRELLDNRRMGFQTRNGQHGTWDPNNIPERILVDICTFGMTEVAVQIENATLRSDARDFANRMMTLRTELQSVKLNEELEDIRKGTNANSNEIKFNQAIMDVKDNEIKQKIIFPVQRLRENRATEMPNSVMFAHPKNEINETLIDWTKNQVNGNFETVDIEGIYDKLDELEEKFKKTGDWNLLLVDDMEKALDTRISHGSIISSMKDIMSAAAEDYHTTLLFKTTNPKNLDSIALQPHRVKRINTDEIKTVEELNIQDAQNRLKDSDYINNTPLSALNDLLLINGNSERLKWNYTRAEYEDVKNKLETLMKKEGYSELTAGALEQLDYIW